jgi:hypothetical protein
MCQYYRWLCDHCIAANDVLVRCFVGQSHQPCARNGQPPLPLPFDAPPLDCQHCFHPRSSAPYHPPSNGDLPAGFTPPQTPTVYRLRVPPDHDVFWQDPALRLPDTMRTLDNYNKQRRGLLTSAAEPQSDAAAQGHDSRGTSGVSWEEAWCRLRNALDAT